MHGDRLSRACDQVVEGGWLLIALALPLYFNVYSSRTFEPDKVALFRSLAVVMAGAWLAGRLTAPRARSRPSPLLLITIALAGTWLLATATSLSPRISLWGSYEWRQGSYTFLCYLALFGLAAARLRSSEQSDRLLTAILFASLPVSLYGILQFAGLDLLPWQSTVENRAVSTLGHPNFLAAYLVMVFPLAAVRLLAAKSALGRLAHGGLLAVQGLCLLLTFSRSGWLAALGGGLVLLLLLAQIHGRLRLFWRLAAIVALLVAGVCILAYADPGGTVSASPFEPLHSALRGKSAATRIRVLEWQAMPSLIAARPVLGYGPDTFSLAFSRVYPPGLAVYGGPNATGEHAHNQILDLAVDAGLLGAALYLAVAAVVVVRGLSVLRRTADAGRQLLLAGLISAVVACLLQHQLSFVTVTPAALLWLYLGWIEALGQHAEPLPQSSFPVPARRLALSGLLAVATLGLVVATNLLPVVADLYAARCTALVEDAQWSCRHRRLRAGPAPGAKPGPLSRAAGARLSGKRRRGLFQPGRGGPGGGRSPVSLRSGLCPGAGRALLQVGRVIRSSPPGAGSGRLPAGRRAEPQRPTHLRRLGPRLSGPGTIRGSRRALQRRAGPGPAPRPGLRGAWRPVPGVGRGGSGGSG